MFFTLEYLERTRFIIDDVCCRGTSLLLCVFSSLGLVSKVSYIRIPPSVCIFTVVVLVSTRTDTYRFVFRLCVQIFCEYYVQQLRGVLKTGIVGEFCVSQHLV